MAILPPIPDAGAVGPTPRRTAVGRSQLAMVGRTQLATASCLMAARLTVVLAAAASHAAPRAASLGPRHRRGGTAHAIVVKGPMLAFTRAALAHYLESMPAVGVVFSHNNGTGGSACSVPFLEQLSRRFPATFDYVIAEPPPRLGLGFRNAQREACYHGVRRAIERWSPRWILVHRPDGAFVQDDVWVAPNVSLPLFGGPGLNAMERLAMVGAAQPPVDGSPPPSLRHVRRLGTCPTQVRVRACVRPGHHHHGTLTASRRHQNQHSRHRFTSDGSDEF